jgi:hypothetical protein
VVNQNTPRQQLSIHQSHRLSESRMIKRQNLIKIQKVMVIIIQILLGMMMMIIIHQQIDSSDGIDQKMSVNGYVMNASMLIKVQMQFVRIADKANNLEVKV